jgi:hypothetical protein
MPGREGHKLELVNERTINQKDPGETGGMAYAFRLKQLGLFLRIGCRYRQDGSAVVFLTEVLARDATSSRNTFHRTQPLGSSFLAQGVALDVDLEGEERS